MEKERICPICGALIERRVTTRVDGSAYGIELELLYVCESPECGFSVAFPFEGETYVARAREEIRRRTHLLPSDERAAALLNSIAYCGRNGDDGLSLSLKAEIEGIFYEALGEILRDARLLLRALSHREPDPKKKRETREKLKVFFDFIERMEGKFPTPRLESEFYAIRDGLIALDSAYELGMLALEENNGTLAEAYFDAGVAAGGIRSRVAYAKYILADRAETPQELSELKEEFRLLASESQEACYEYARRAEIGVDDLAEAIFSYEERTYPTLSTDGKLSFLRLLLSVSVELYEPTLSLLLASDSATADGERIEQILSELSRLIDRASEECDALLRAEADRVGVDAGDRVFKRMMLEEEKALLSYVIGCQLYHASVFDPKKRFDLRYLRVAIGHFDAFLQYGAFSLVGLSSIERVEENANVYRRILSVCAGLGGEA